VWHAQLALRVRREGSDYIVEACIPQQATGEAASSGGSSSSSSLPIRVGSGAVDSAASEWTQLRICHLMEDVSPAGVAKDGQENVEFGLQLQAACEVLPLSGVAAGLYAVPSQGVGSRRSLSGCTLCLVGCLGTCENRQHLACKANTQRHWFPACKAGCARTAVSTHCDGHIW
jgi:hypothetical protein